MIPLATPVSAWQADMRFADGRIQSFELKFRKVDEDTERYLLAPTDLLELTGPDIEGGEFATSYLLKITAAMGWAGSR